MNEQSATQPQRDRLLKVFEFLKAYLDLRFPPVRDIGQQMRTLWLKDLPQHTSIEVLRNAVNADEQSEDSDIILRITRPSLTNCPSPPGPIAEWIKSGWQDIDGKPEFHPSRNVLEKDGRARIERFEDVPQRPTLFRRWQQERVEWQENERPARRALAVFQTVYEWFGIHEREAERIELLVADGLLNCSDVAGDFNHQVLLQRLELEFYPEKRNPEFVFRKREQPPELYLEFLRSLPEANHQQIAKCVVHRVHRHPVRKDGREHTGGLRRVADPGQWRRSVHHQPEVFPASPDRGSVTRSSDGTSNAAKHSDAHDPAECCGSQSRAPSGKLPPESGFCGLASLR